MKLLGGTRSKDSLTFVAYKNIKGLFCDIYRLGDLEREGQGTETLGLRENSHTAVREDSFDFAVSQGDSQSLGRGWPRVLNDL